MDLLRTLVIKTTFLVVFSAAAHAQESRVGIDFNGDYILRDGQDVKSSENKAVRYYAGESIPLWSPQNIQENKPVRYFAGDSIPIGAPESVRDNSSLKAEAARKTKVTGYSAASAIPLAGALGDSVSTLVGINHAGLAEKNSLINTSAAGLIGLFVVKAGIVYYFDHQEPVLRKSGLKTVAGVWSGLAMNNILLIGGSSSPVGIVGGALFGAYMYHREGLVLEKEKTTRNAPGSKVRAK